MTLIQTIADNINVPEQMLNSALKTSQLLVKHFKMEKRNGSNRIVYQPDKRLKIIEYWLMANVFGRFKIHPAATAFTKDKSIKQNAEIHRRGKYFLKLDFRDFFPSITFSDLEPIVVSWLEEEMPHFDKVQLLDTIKKACFLSGKLPIGYPSSPMISNIVMYQFDAVISNEILSVDEYGSCNYTRYADDIVFSTDMTGASRKLQELVETTLTRLASPKLELNRAKTRHVSSSGGSALVTGLRVCHDGHITVHRKYKDKIRLLLALYNKDQLAPKEVPVLRGHLAYIQDVDGAFYTKLKNKYLLVMEKLLSS